MLETFTSPSLGNAANLVLERSADEKKPINTVLKFQTKKDYIICSTTGKPTRSFATERVSLDSG
jgi:hypothetical protein